MRGTRLLFAASLLSLMVSCDSSAPANFPTTPTVPVVPPPAASLKLIGTHTEFFVGHKTTVYAMAHDAAGRLANADKTTMSSSDPGVITLSLPELITIRAVDGSQAQGLKKTLTMVGAGTAIVRASLDGVSDSLILIVKPVPPPSTALVIDSFTVIEYHVRCAWDCPYLAYAPLLKLREPTGTSPVDLLAVQFDVSSKSTGLCSAGPLKLGAGFAGHINRIHDYAWANDMVLFQLNGVPLPDGPARARVIFRDSRGVAGMAEAQGEIQRMVSNPQFPVTTFDSAGWLCADHFEGAPLLPPGH